jgi:RimK-like ATP-grasp domain
VSTQCDVVIVAPMHDLHARAVIDEIKHRGRTVALASLRHLTKGDSLTIGGNVVPTSVLRIGDTFVDLTQAKSIWWRRPENPVGRVDGTTATWFKHQEWESLILSLETACPCNWINRPSRQWIAKRKALQMAAAANLGLRTPETLITNDADQVRTFKEKFPRVIYKSMGETAHQNTATRLLSDADMRRLDDLAACPAIFQEFIEATHDIRVTVVGDRMFPVQIDSQNGQSTLDWRFDHSVNFESVMLDPEIEARLSRLMRELELTYGAIDLRRTPEGEHVFLEVNPAGQYLFAELLTGARITEAMADELLLV